LDFILHSPALRSLDFQAPQIPYSDHVPLIWDFEALGQDCRVAA
jgi:hypothetical protein